MFPILLGKNNDLEKRVKTLEDSGGGDSSGGSVLVVTDTNGTLDKTWQEISEADFAIIKSPNDDNSGAFHEYVASNRINEGVYIIETDNQNFYTTNSANGYPTLYIPNS